MRYGQPKKVRRISPGSDAAQGNSTTPRRSLNQRNEAAYRRMGWVKRKNGTWGPPNQGFYKGQRNARS